MYTALKARIPFLDINQEREFGYEGYTGMRELARQLALTIQSPVWAAVRKPAPWMVLPATSTVPTHLANVVKQGSTNELWPVGACRQRGAPFPSWPLPARGALTSRCDRPSSLFFARVTAAIALS
jgi:hypothetical protein